MKKANTSPAQNIEIMFGIPDKVEWQLGSFSSERTSVINSQQAGFSIDVGEQDVEFFQI